MVVVKADDVGMDGLVAGLAVVKGECVSRVVNRLVASLVGVDAGIILVKAVVEGRPVELGESGGDEVLSGCPGFKQEHHRHWVIGSSFHVGMRGDGHLQG